MFSVQSIISDFLVFLRTTGCFSTEQQLFVCGSCAKNTQGGCHAEGNAKRGQTCCFGRQKHATRATMAPGTSPWYNLSHLTLSCAVAGIEFGLRFNDHFNGAA